MPRPVHTKKDENAAAAFKAGFLGKLQSLALSDATPVRIWVSDEMRYGLHPVTRRVWSERGHKPVVKVDPRFDWGYTYGAIEVTGSNAAEFAHMPTVNLDVSLEFLRQIAATDPGTHHVVIWDGAGFHQKSGYNDLPKNLSLITLPPYSPELNAIEKLWDVVKDRICNGTWKNLCALEDAITAVLRDYWTTPSLVKSLFGEGWLYLSANSSNLANQLI